MHMDEGSNGEILWALQKQGMEKRRHWGRSGDVLIGNDPEVELIAWVRISYGQMRSSGALGS